MPVVDGPSCSWVIKRQGKSRGRIKEQTDVFVDPWLVLFDRKQVVAARLDHLLAEATLTKEGITREHPTLPIDALDKRRSHTEFSLGLINLGLIGRAIGYCLISFADWLLG